MALLKIDLQDGFTGDLVVIRVNGSEIFRKDGIKTNLATSRASSLEFDFSGDSLMIEAALPKKGLSGAIELDASKPAYLGVSIIDNKIHFVASSTPFVYF